MFYVRTPRETGDEMIGSALSLLWMVVHSVQENYSQLTVKNIRNGWMSTLITMDSRALCTGK
jgi:hypothetical protein